jgi:hypothetical protein
MPSMRKRGLGEREREQAHSPTRWATKGQEVDTSLDVGPLATGRGG